PSFLFPRTSSTQIYTLSLHDALPIWAEGGFLSYGWEGYSEAMLLYILGLGSPTHPLPEESYGAWTGSYQWENLYDIDFLFAAPRSEEHTSELQSRGHLVCRLLLEKKK